MNQSSTRFLSIPSRRDQLFYFITFCRFCQVNILWTEVHSIFSFPFPRQPVQNSYPIHSTTLQTFCQVNFSWTTSTAPLSISRSVSRFLLSTSFLVFRSRATALLLYHTIPSLSSRYFYKICRFFWIICINPRCSAPKSHSFAAFYTFIRQQITFLIPIVLS